MRNRHRKHDVPSNLRWREIASSFYAGMTGVDRKLVENKIVVPILTGQTDDEASLLRTESARIKSIRLDTRKIDRLLPGLAKNIKAAQAKFDERLAACRLVEKTEPPSFGTFWSKAPAAFLLVCDSGVAFWVLCDTAGCDLSRGIEDIPVSTGLLLGAFSLLIVFINAQAGFLATSPVSPRRRLLGVVGLVLISGTLAVLRAQSVAEGGIALGLLGAVVTIVAGVFGGILQRKMLPIIKAHREHRQKLGLATKIAAEAEEKVAVAKSELEKTEAQKKTLLAEAEALQHKPQERASQRADIDLIQAARLKAVRYYYALGQRFAGKGRKNLEGGDV
jgi:hypothetical protein